MTTFNRFGLSISCGGNGLDGTLGLVINESGVDTLVWAMGVYIRGNEVLCADSRKSGLVSAGAALDQNNGTGAASYGQVDLNVGSLSDSSIRLETRRNDMGGWIPRDIIFWGEIDGISSIIPPVGSYIEPIALELGLSRTLNKSGFRSSMPLNRVYRGDGSTIIQHLLMVVTTKHGTHAGTDSPIRLRIQSGTNQLVNWTMRDTSQPDLERNKANLYLIPVERNFTFNELDNRSITLEILGTDMWEPLSIVLFGLDRSRGRVDRVVPLAARDFSYGDEALSADSREGSQLINLGLLKFEGEC